MGEGEDVNDTSVFSLFFLFQYGYRVCPFFFFFSSWCCCSFVSFLSLIMKRAYLGLVLVPLRIIDTCFLCDCDSYDHMFQPVIYM